MKDIGEALSRHRSRVDRLKGDYRASRKAARREKAALRDAQGRLAAADEARRIAQLVAEAVQREAHGKVAGLVTRCLTAVFGRGAYEFVIRLEKKRHRTEPRMAFLRDGEEVDPLTAAGGGAVDVAAFGLRLAVLLMRHPRPRRLLVLDEPFKMLSRDYTERVAALVLSLSHELDFQFIVVTHNEDLKIGKVVQIKKPKVEKDSGD